MKYISNALDYIYCAALACVNKKEEGNSVRRAHRAVIIMSAIIVVIISSTLMLALSFFININGTGPLLFLFIIFIVSFIIYNTFKHVYILKKKYKLLYSKSLLLKNGRESLMLMYFFSFLYYTLISYVSGHINHRF